MPVETPEELLRRLRNGRPILGPADEDEDDPEKTPLDVTEEEDE